MRTHRVRCGKWCVLCRTCDFDVCDVCFRKENKDTKENVVRGDKGVKLKEVPIEISAVTSLSNSQLLTLK